MPEISSADFQLFQEYMRSRAPALAPAPAPAAPEVKTIDECLMTFRDCVVGKDQAMAMAPAPASSTSMALAPAPASSTSMALAPATASSTSVALAPATAAAVVATSVLSSGQEIQKGELTITTSPVPAVSTQPTGITASGSFTLSIDINMTTLPNGSLLRVIGQGVHPGQPGLWLFPAGAGGNVWLRFHVGNSAVDLVTDNTPPTYNTYYNITAVYDGTTRQATLYHNGVLTASAAIDPTGFAPLTPAMFGWNQQNLTAPTVKVKNTYWFNKALTAAEIKTIANSASASTASPVLSSGQAIQIQEVEISQNPPPFTAPAGIVTTGPVTYTMSMDIKIDQVGPMWRNIMAHGEPDWPPGGTGRRPAVYITGNDRAPANRILVVHGSAEEENKNIVTQFAATPGQYFNLTWVVDGGKLTTYVNGLPDANGTVSGAFTWGSSEWKWSDPRYQNNRSGPVNVKNVYWFNKALTAAEIKTIASPAGSGTSGYAHEGSPFGGLVGRRNWRLVLILFLLVIMLWIIAKKM